MFQRPLWAQRAKSCHYYSRRKRCLFMRNKEDMGCLSICWTVIFSHRFPFFCISKQASLFHMFVQWVLPACLSVLSPALYMSKTSSVSVFKGLLRKPKGGCLRVPIQLSHQLLVVGRDPEAERDFRRSGKEARGLDCSDWSITCWRWVCQRNRDLSPYFQTCLLYKSKTGF